MNIIDKYQQYAQAFEETYEDDDWSRIAPFFTEDAVYEFGFSRAEGLPAVLDTLKNSVNGLDRRMDSRTGDFQTPTADGDTVRMDWKATYTKSGLPDLVIWGRELAVFRGDRICHLRDELDPAAEAGMAQWMTTHGTSLSG